MNFSATYKNAYYDKQLAAGEAFAAYNGVAWSQQSLPPNPPFNQTYVGAVTKSLTKPSDIMLVGNCAFMYTGWFAGAKSTMPVSGTTPYEAVAGGIPNNNWMALDMFGRTTTLISTGYNSQSVWTTPKQLFSKGPGGDLITWGGDLAIIQSSSLASSRYVAVGYKISTDQGAAELYVSSLIPDSQITNYNMNNLSWKKIAIPNGAWFKIANTASAIDRKTNIAYITENPDQTNVAQNRALVTSDFGESWDIINLPSDNGSKGSFLYLNKSTINGQPTMQWFVSNGRNRAGEPPARLYSGARFL
jgi:hypothetical protein